MTRLDFHKWLIDFTLYDEKIKSIHIQKVTQVTQYIEIIYKFGITNIFGRHFNHIEEYPELKSADYGNLKEEIKTGERRSNVREIIKKALKNLLAGPELGDEKLFLATVALLLGVGISGLIMGLALVEGCL